MLYQLNYIHRFEAAKIQYFISFVQKKLQKPAKIHSFAVKRTVALLPFASTTGPISVPPKSR